VGGHGTVKPSSTFPKDAALQASAEFSVLPQVSSSGSWAISVSTGKQTYQTGESIHINGTITGGPAFFACSTGGTCTTTIPPIMGVVTVFNAAKVAVAFQDLAFTPTDPSIYPFQMEIAGGLPAGAYSVDAEAGAVGYPSILATTSFTVATGTTPSSPRCVIATAAYGSELAGPVQFLRDFRDHDIQSTTFGQAFLAAFNSWYYSWAPQVARMISTSDWLKATVRAFIFPLVGALVVSHVVFQGSLVLGPEVAVVVAGVTASALTGAIYLTIPFGIVLRATRRRMSLNTLLSLSVVGIALSLYGTLSNGMIGPLENVTAVLVVESILLTPALIHRIGLKAHLAVQRART